MVRGKVFILSAPSGTGKTTVAKKILSELQDVEKVVTYTTRPPRPGEESGVDYVFVSREEFEKKVSENFFLEYANVYGNYYGTPKPDVERITSQGKDALLVIDVQGAFKIKKEIPDAVGIFLLPPSFEELRRRIESRGYRDENIEKRLKTAEKEIPCARYFDYIVINDFLNTAVEKVKAIILSYRCRTERVLGEIDKSLRNREIINLLQGGECYVKET
ncbi:MAG: guanylate kinase [Aquificae bacterium]|nr:guanylate kinase [Aquificota bacterium]